MSFDPFTAVVDLVKEAAGPLIKHFLPDPQAQKEAEAKLEQLAQSGELARMVNATDTLKLILADVQSARQREAQVAATDAPAITKVIVPVLALTVTVGGGIMLWLSQDGDTKMAIVGLMTLVLGYYFGTSQGSTKANQLFRDIVRKQ
jgi:hypothetical protein